MKATNPVDNVTDLIRIIIDGKCDIKETERLIEKMESEQGDSLFHPCEFKPKDRPWKKEYLIELEKQRLSGISSKEYLLHLAEVETFFRKRKLMISLLIVGSVLLIVLFILSVIK